MPTARDDTSHNHSAPNFPHHMWLIVGSSYPCIAHTCIHHTISHNVRKHAVALKVQQKSVCNCIHDIHTSITSSINNQYLQPQLWPTICLSWLSIATTVRIESTVIVGELIRPSSLQHPVVTMRGFHNQSHHHGHITCDKQWQSIKSHVNHWLYPLNVSGRGATAHPFNF